MPGRRCMLAVLEAIIFAVDVDARAEAMSKLFPRSDDHDGACSVRGHGEVVNDDIYTLYLRKQDARMSSGSAADVVVVKIDVITFTHVCAIELYRLMSPIRPGRLREDQRGPMFRCTHSIRTKWVGFHHTHRVNSAGAPPLARFGEHAHGKR